MEDAYRESFDFWYSLGLHINKAGNVSDVLKGGISDKAGFGPGMIIVAVNGRAYTPDVLKAAVRDGKGSGPGLELIVENTGFYKVIKLDYHEGERYPLLERVSSVPDRLDDILKPEAK
jgi:predicted metalloprotease with PDZ domain